MTYLGAITQLERALARFQPRPVARSVKPASPDREAPPARLEAPLSPDPYGCQACALPGQAVLAEVLLAGSHECDVRRAA